METNQNKITNGTLSVARFNDGYFELHKHLINNGDNISSRNGETYEILNFKTEVTNPLARCVGGRERNINVFFLLAEALWIWAGRRDVKFLEIFNKQITEYSDDGVYFHAPYGWRLRNYGIDSLLNHVEGSNVHAFQGFDQIEQCLNLLSKNPEDRRAVASIWNADLDLNVSRKDIPCNDMLMFKVRDNKLHMTIQNRSNDLDWGLCTNVFQFSFILENMAKVLGVEVGTQTHNSQSLHLYKDNPLTQSIEKSDYHINLYDTANTPTIDYNFDESSSYSERLNLVDFWIKSMISNLNFQMRDGVYPEEKYKDNLFTFSEFLYMVYMLLELYIKFKNKVISRYEAIEGLYFISKMRIAYKSDYIVLALNFFVCRFEAIENPKDKEKTEELIAKIRQEINEYIGKY